MPVPLIPDNSYVYIVCLGDVAGPLFLNADTSSGNVSLSTQIGSAGVNLSGTLWRANTLSSWGNVAYSFQTLGSGAGSFYKFLEGKPDLSVSLSNAVGEYASWNLITPVRQLEFPMYPWDPNAHGSTAPYFTFLLQCIGNTRYLDGATGNGRVALVDTDITKPAGTGSNDNTGTRWAVLVPGYTTAP